METTKYELVQDAFDAVMENTVCSGGIPSEWSPLFHFVKSPNGCQLVITLRILEASEELSIDELASLCEQGDAKAIIELLECQFKSLLKAAAGKLCAIEKPYREILYKSQEPSQVAP